MRWPLLSERHGTTARTGIIFNSRTRDAHPMWLDARGWKVCALPDCREARVSGAHARAREPSWLRGFKADPTTMTELRSVLARMVRRDISRMSNDDVVNTVAALLADDRLHVHVEVVKAMATESAPPAPPPFQPPTFQRAPTRTPSSPRPTAVDPPTFPSSANLVSQAAALVAAAAAGAPFCPI